jgi:hypothetical protein
MKAPAPTKVKALSESQLRRIKMNTITCTARTPEGKFRQRVHQMRRELNLSEPAYRNVLYSLTGDRYARNLSAAQLEVVVAFLEREAANKRCPVEYVSDTEALDVLGLAA